MRYHYKISTFAFAGNSFLVWFDLFLIFFSAAAVIADFFHIYTADIDKAILMSLAIIGFLPVLYSAFRALISRRLTIDLLAAIALFFSFLSQEWRSAVFISLMLASARFFAYFTENRTKNAIKKLLKLKPEKIHLKIDGQVIEKKLGDIKIGDLIVVDSGERIPVDGIIVSGNASVNQSFLTGESEPIFKKEGDEVLSSTLNVSGSLVVKTTKIGEDTAFSKILKLIEESQEGKAPINSLTDKFAAYYISITLIASIFLYFFSGNLGLVLSVLLVACADDLAVAIPLAFMASITAAARKGIIIKGASYIEGFRKVKTIIFDKTGTITLGKPEVQNVVLLDSYSEREMLAIIGAVVSNSIHPASQAIYNFIKKKRIKCLALEDPLEKPGYGIKGKIGRRSVFAGKPDFLKENGIKFSQKELELFEKEKSFGRSLVLIGINKKLIGFVSLTDTIHHQARNVIEDLRKMGVQEIIMLTGDNEFAAKRVADYVNIYDFRANLLPQDKVEIIKKTLNKNHKTVMVGDGINDAASLALADIGVAMGSIGSDVAIETADIALMKDRLSNIIDLLKLSRYTMRIVIENICLWAVINIIGLFLVFAGILNPDGAATYNFITDFIPLFNSLRVFLTKI